VGGRGGGEKMRKEGEEKRGGAYSNIENTSKN
jgi:hypothetical protein